MSSESKDPKPPAPKERPPQNPPAPPPLPRPPKEDQIVTIKETDPGKKGYDTYRGRQ